MRRSTTPDAGFTLIEVLVSIVILGLVVGSIGGAFFAFMSTNERSGDERAIARDQYSLSSWFVGDAQSAASVDTSATLSTGCQDDHPYNANTSRSVAQLTWTDQSVVPAVTYHAWYRVERPNPSEPWRLERVFCEDGEPETRIVVAQSVVVTPSPVVQQPNGRIELRITSGVDGTTQLLAAGTRRVATP